MWKYLLQNGGQFAVRTTSKPPSSVVRNRDSPHMSSYYFLESTFVEGPRAYSYRLNHDILLMSYELGMSNLALSWEIPVPEWLCKNGRYAHFSSLTSEYNFKLAIISSDNGLSPGRRQAIIWTNAGILLIGPLGTNFSEILIEIQTFSFRKMHLNMSSAKWRPFCLGSNVLKNVLSPSPHS